MTKGADATLMLNNGACVHYRMRSDDRIRLNDGSRTDQRSGMNTHRWMDYGRRMNCDGPLGGRQAACHTLPRTVPSNRNETPAPIHLPPYVVRQFAYNHHPEHCETVARNVIIKNAFDFAIGCLKRGNRHFSMTARTNYIEFAPYLS